MTQERHHGLKTNLIGFMRLRDVLEKALQDIEREVWEERFQPLDDPGDADDRNPNDVEGPCMPLHLALEAAPGLRGLLDQALFGFTLPDHTVSTLENAYHAAVNHVTTNLDPGEREALEALAERIIRDGNLENPDGLLVLEPDHVLHAVRTRDIIGTYVALREAGADWGGMPAWEELPVPERARIIEDCGATLNYCGGNGLVDLVEFVAVSNGAEQGDAAGHPRGTRDDEQNSGAEGMNEPAGGFRTPQGELMAGLGLDACAACGREIGEEESRHVRADTLTWHSADTGGVAQHRTLREARCGDCGPAEEEPGTAPPGLDGDAGAQPA